MMFFSSGDGPFYYQEEISALSWMPKIWESFKGFGENLLPRLWIDYPFRFIVKLLATLGLEWGVIEKILWIAVAFIGAVCIYQLSAHVIGKKAAYLSILLYMTNTYALFLFGGGQLGVAFAYGLTPLVLLKFIKTIDATKDGGKISLGLENGLWLALLIVCDLRLAYLMLCAAGIYYLIRIVDFKKDVVQVLRSFIRIFVVPILVAALIHSFWILPTIMKNGNAAMLGEDFTNPGMLRFLSFADFPHALSLLHPNWPENLFGKVYFLQPEFLIFPLLAFGALLFVSHRKTVLYVALLTALGAFFAKGAQQPFEFLFIWCFTHLPGFVMFRDPTKFYLFVAIGYSILIPLVLDEMTKHQRKIRWIVYGGLLLFWCFTIRPFFLGQLSGNFRQKAIPQEYERLKNMLIADKTPSRTLWIPSKEKFTYASDTHPALAGLTLFDNASISEMMITATSSSFVSILNNAGVRYVIVPKDIERTMYMTEYKFDSTLRDRMIETMSMTPLTTLSQYKEVTVFENPSFVTMTSSIPEVVVKQQELVNIGFMISITSLLFIIIMVCL